jgi:hypothetical protein
VKQDRPVEPERLATLHRRITSLFNLDELHNLSLYLGLTWENLAGSTLDAKTTSLLEQVNNRSQLPTLLEWLAKLRPKETWQLDELLAPPEPPYRGLEFYREQDAANFFGRECLAEELAARLADYPFLAVVGGSGSGKSSVMRAGVIPLLKAPGTMNGEVARPRGSTSWAYLTLTPAAQPIERLAIALTSDLAMTEPTAALARELVAQPSAMRQAAGKFLQRQARDHLCLLVDQFEEVFSDDVAEGERQAFIDGLLYATEPGGLLTLLICLRADFYHRCDPYPALRAALERNQTYIGAPDTTELCEAIMRPATRLGYTLEPGLAELILRETGRGPGRLPLLSHALHETWLRRYGAEMTLAGYQEAGRVDGAIAATADTLYRSLPPEQKEIMRNIFLSLVQVSESAPASGRRATRAELAAAGESPDAGDLLEALIAARLVVIDQDTVQITHDALIGHWPQLGVWIDESRERLIFRQRLETAAALWAASNHDTDYLYSGRQLSRALEGRRDFTLSPDGRVDDFLLASRHAAARRQRAGGLRLVVVMLAGALAVAISGYLLLTGWLAVTLGVSTIVAAFAVLGSIAGLLYGPGSDWVAAWAGDEGLRRHVINILWGFVVFGLVLCLLNIATPQVSWGLLFMVGGIWGVVAALGRSWAGGWPRRVPVVAAACGVVLALAYLTGLQAGTSGFGPIGAPRLPLVIVFVAGALLPPAVLLAEWAGQALGQRSMR